MRRTARPICPKINEPTACPLLVSAASFKQIATAGMANRAADIIVAA
jgi:hypothetical protein